MDKRKSVRQRWSVSSLRAFKVNGSPKSKRQISHECNLLLSQIVLPSLIFPAHYACPKAPACNGWLEGAMPLASHPSKKATHAVAKTAANDGNLFLLGVNLCRGRYGMAGTPSLLATTCSVAIVLSIFALLLDILHNRPYVALMKAKLLRPILLQSE